MYEILWLPLKTKDKVSFTFQTFNDPGMNSRSQL